MEVINDRDRELVNFWRVIQNHLDPFIECFKWAVTSRKMFDWENMKRPETLTDIQRAVRYYYLQRLCFGGKVRGRTFGTSAVGTPRLTLSDLEEKILQVHWRMEKVMIECLDACECISRYDRPGTLFYVDPPYYHLSQGYDHQFKDEDFVRLEKTLAGIKGKFILSLNDHPDVRRMFAAFKMEGVSLVYSAGNSRSSATTRAEQRKELLIRNF